MRKLLAVVAVAGAVSAPIAAQAQTEITTGVVRGGSVIVEDDDDIDGIAVDQRPAFREYVIRERMPSYTVPERVIVGGVLPDAGVRYRYTVVNGRTVLIEPRSRRIVQVVE